MKYFTKKISQLIFEYHQALEGLDDFIEILQSLINTL